MDFRDSPREAAFRAEARAFLEAHKPARWRHPFEDGVDEHELLAGQKAWQRTLFEHGWAAVLWPKEYGGRGAGPIEAIVWNQELARVGLGESIFVVGT
ncbi:MAG TPA: acyl-CoA dehydrogenase family protein, partial [Myxococcota bacterium]|nr:acyl-CoA dehydrogenase family protein [Myxococcota bacterium]